ncbi:MAG: glycogen-binding domain-containing protein [Candidatus Omnitrophica bacterium]|nr:glycogen-binding domain-containing protein [Candidatus Omnitrophota bacterium]
MAKASTAIPTQFKLYAPGAKQVTLAGSFNNWDIRKLRAKKDSRGNWTVKVNLRPGTYEYKFFVDGSWITDPKCTRMVPNPFGSQNSVIEIR